jgi:hypothetical protein
VSVPEPGGPDPAGFAGAAVRLLLCRLSTYPQVLASVTHRALAWAARAVDGVYVDTAYRPPPAGRARHGAGWIATASGEPARRFDVLGVTLTAPQEALNLPRLLRDSGLPLGHAARLADPSAPLVLLGGHSAAIAPFLHGTVPGADGPGTDAGLVDAVAAGDGIGALREILALLVRSRAAGASKRDALAEIGRRVAGAYVPSAYEHVTRGGRLVEIRPRPAAGALPAARRNDPPEAWSGYDGAWIPWSDDAPEETLPVAWACPHRCRFCRDGWAGGPHRQLAADVAVSVAERLKANLAASDLNLLSPDLGCQRDLPALLARLLAVWPRISAKSLAGISLLRTPAVAALLPRLGKRELSVGVEGASERLRRCLGKRFDADALPSLLGPMARAGLRLAKLFFIATGLEERDDFRALDALLGAVAAAAPRLRLVVSVMPLFPSPGTPLAFAPLLPGVADSCRELDRVARAHGAECRLSARPEEIRIVSLLVRAGRAATPTLVRAALEDDILYDDEIRPGDARRIERRLVEAGIDVGALAAEVGAGDPLPTDDIDLGTPRTALRDEYERALREAASAAEARGAVSRRRGGAEPGPGLDPRRHDARGRDASALQDLPDPFARRVAVGFLFRVDAAAADRPAMTLARGALREWFLRDEPAARAFAGVREVAGPDGTSGLRLGVVEFAAGHAPELPASVAALEPAGTRGRPAVPFGLVERIPERPWFLARAAGSESFGILRAVVAASRPAVRHRVERAGAGRRLLVERGYRGRCGLAVALLDGTALFAFVSPGAARLAREFARRRGAPLEAVRVFDQGPGRCPCCGSAVLVPVVPPGEATCPECGAGPTGGT